MEMASGNIQEEVLPELTYKRHLRGIPALIASGLGVFIALLIFYKGVNHERDLCKNRPSFGSCSTSEVFVFDSSGPNPRVDRELVSH